MLHGLRNLFFRIADGINGFCFLSLLHVLALFILSLLILRQVVFLQQCRDFVRAPQPVVDLAVLCLAHRRKLDCKDTG